MIEPKVVSAVARLHRAWRALLLAGCVSAAAAGPAAAQSFEADVTPLVETSCLACHGDRTVTPLNLARLGFDLTDRATYRAWERVYERVENGEMPPAAVPRPDAAVVETALGSLKRALVDANLTARGGQRTPLRRLTRLEYAYTHLGPAGHRRGGRRNPEPGTAGGSRFGRIRHGSGQPEHVAAARPGLSGRGGSRP